MDEPDPEPRLYSVFDSATWPGTLEVLEGGGQKALFYRADETLTPDANFGVEVGEDVYRFLTGAELDTIVTAALEGPQVELDALLGPAAPAEPALTHIMLGDGGAIGLLGDGASGQSFIADLAQQHVVVQLEQMASAGHA